MLSFYFNAGGGATDVSAVGPLHGPLAGGTRLTLIGLSLVAYSPTPMPSKSADGNIISQVSIGNMPAIIDAFNRSGNIANNIYIKRILFIIIIVYRPFSTLRTGWTFYPIQAPPTRSLNL